MEREWIEKIQAAADEEKPPEAGRILGERVRWSGRMQEAVRLWQRVYENDPP